MDKLIEFRAGLMSYMISPYARPFVCSGSPLDCHSFIVGLNAATRLNTDFSSYWSDETGFDRKKFEQSYNEVRVPKGNRPVIEAISFELGNCLETNLYAVPTKKASELTPQDRENPIIEYLFFAIRPKLVFVHSKEPITFFTKMTGCENFTNEVKHARWKDHSFLIFGRMGPLYTLGANKGAALGRELAKYL